MPNEVYKTAKLKSNRFIVKNGALQANLLSFAKLTELQHEFEYLKCYNRSKKQNFI